MTKSKTDGETIRKYDLEDRCNRSFIRRITRKRLPIHMNLHTKHNGTTYEFVLVSARKMSYNNRILSTGRR